MPRVTAVRKPGDYPGVPDETTKAALAELFGYLFPQGAGEIDRGHSGVAIAALNPKLALHAAQLSRFIVLETAWGRRRDLLELAIQTLNLHFKCSFAFETRLPGAAAAGVTVEQLAAIPLWETSGLFSEEQKLVVAYTQAVVRGDVPAELFARVVERYGEKEAVEFTSAVGWFSFWAMLLNATRPE
jgi:alkylhydroperoxidase family enzyme